MDVSVEDIQAESGAYRRDRLRLPLHRKFSDPLALDKRREFYRSASLPQRPNEEYLVSISISLPFLRSVAMSFFFLFFFGLLRAAILKLAIFFFEIGWVRFSRVSWRLWCLFGL